MRRATVLAAAVLACVITLTGCVGSGSPATTPTASPYSADVASRLQAGVLAVSSSAAGGDPTAALARLDELAATLADARARSEVTAARFDSISASIALVRTDLEAAILAQNETKPHNSDKPGKGSDGKND